MKLTHKADIGAVARFFTDRLLDGAERPSARSTRNRDLMR